ncbi:response regulator transcription factor [Arthrobacter sp. C152]
MLDQVGFEVRTAMDGHSGLEAVRAAQPALVTVDVGLPDFDGFEILRRIRGLSDAYIVMLTGRTAETDVLNALQAGADDYIAKPFRPREVRARIEAMMGSPRDARNGRPVNMPMTDLNTVRSIAATVPPPSPLRRP